ncbi:ankyrin repeat domain-containing protein [Legionella pneumophila]|uniref:ankyrin repeat domain-containing protein n=1 Tax=Legionella pneumophila TaxID=446 RepID=UPI000777DCB0|nr:ankyrin repeat domain-containing protein [Legionella pneumophila]MDW8872777.1 hypothetical protein [Legionella pneumophila]HAT8656825.1 hypothetical protein [Legionella pneumophila]
MLNLKFLKNKIIGNNAKEMDFFLLCKNGELTDKILHDYIYHYRIDINTPFAGDMGEDGKTPLMFYFYSSNSTAEISQLMINHGADVNIKTRLERTPFYYLAYSHSEEKLKIIKLLKKEGADFDGVDRLGFPLIASYLTTSNLEQLEFVINNSRFAKLNLESCPYPWGRGPLQELILNRPFDGLDVVREKILFLIENGFNINLKMKSPDAYTPLSFLRREMRVLEKTNDFFKEKYIDHYRQIEHILLENGAKE